MPKASVIFLSYNQADYVAEALVSALDQAYHDFEVIVADDGSTDGTISIIDSIIRNHPKGRLVRRLDSKTNIGLVQNWNRAVEAARGEVIVAQAGDDISRPDRLSVTVKRFSEDAGLKALFSQIDLIDKQSKVFRRSYEGGRFDSSVHRYSGGVDGFEFWQGAPVLGACGAYHISLAREFGPLSYALSEDQPYVYRALLSGTVGFEKETLVQWRWHGENLSIGSLEDETDRLAAMRKRTNMYFARYQAAEQYANDANKALEIGMISRERFADELKRISGIKAIELLGGRSIEPECDYREWVQSAIDVFRYNAISPRSLGFIVRNIIQRHIPRALKLIATRPAR